ncbi:MAG: glucose-6-phosphate isomerase [Gammaproteobacteria bacterium]|nr:glucose-6-phosphate isomerase [Gammaproteobacteria bacterium]
MISNPTNLPLWSILQDEYERIKDVHMRDMFEQDPERFEKFSIKFNDILFDFSKNRIESETLKLLINLAEQCNVGEWRDHMFAGDPINHTEGRAVQHAALRQRPGKRAFANGEEISQEIEEELQRVKALAESIRTRQWRGATNQPITDVVNIGIGGSHLGPLMVTEALRPYAIHDLKVHYVNNIDENHINNTLEALNPETTLFIIASKSFTTQDTLVNAHTAREWLLNRIENESDLHHHLVAVSANMEAAQAFGVAPENVFKMWDWVGGRYSLWSAIGLSIVISIGAENFDALLDGAYEVDQHFRTAPLAENIPVLMALIGIWYNNFFNSESIVILPYDQNMHRFPAYLQQADMESNGKCRDRQGNHVDYQTGPILFGEIGIASQHAFYQLLHQGTKLVPADMLVPISNQRCIARHHRALMSNIFAQAEALMLGKNEDEVTAELKAEGMSAEEIEKLLPYKLFPGNRPTNTFVFYTLDPKTLGSLIAMYEHKIFVQGIIWNLNSFDQWGVELGKKLANEILTELNTGEEVDSHDCSTNGLINYYLRTRPEKS